MLVNYACCDDPGKGALWRQNSKLLSGSNANAPSPSLAVVGAGQPVAGRRRGSGRALVADRELARRHPLVKVVVEEDEALVVRVEILVIGRPQLAEPAEDMNKTQVSNGH